MKCNNIRIKRFLSYPHKSSSQVQPSSALSPNYSQRNSEYLPAHISLCCIELLWELKGGERGVGFLVGTSARLSQIDAHLRCRSRPASVPSPPSWPTALSSPGATRKSAATARLSSPS